MSLLSFLKSFRVLFTVEPLAGPDRTITIRDLTISFQGSLHMQTTLPDDKVLPFVGPTGGLDVHGNPTTLAGTVKVSVSDPTILTLVQPDPTTPTIPNSGTVTATGPLGTAQLKFEDDTDASAPLVALIDVQVIAGSTVSLAPPALGALRDPAAVDPNAAAEAAAAAANPPAP